MIYTPYEKYPIDIGALKWFITWIRDVLSSLKGNSSIFGIVQTLICAEESQIWNILRL